MALELPKTIEIIITEYTSEIITKYGYLSLTSALGQSIKAKVLLCCVCRLASYRINGKITSMPESFWVARREVVPKW